MTTDLLILGTMDGALSALDGRDGSSLWRRELGRLTGPSALVRVADVVIAAALDGYVCALALADGALRWEMTIPDVPQGSGPNNPGHRVVTNGEVVVIEHGPTYTGHDPADGHIVWSSGASREAQGWWLLGVGAEYAYVLQMEYPAAPPSPTPEPVRARVLPHFVTSALSTWDGTPQWFLYDQSARGPSWDGAPSLVEADGVLYTYGQGLHAIDAAIHHPLRWTWEYLPEIPLGGGGGMLAVGREAVIVANEGYLGAFRRDTGTPLWAEQGARREDGYFEVFSGLVTLGEVVYVGRGLSSRGVRIEARTESTGVLRWSWPGDPSILGFNDAWRFRGAGDTLYVPSGDHIWGLRATDGQELWHREFPRTPTAFLAVTETSA